MPLRWSPRPSRRFPSATSSWAVPLPCATRTTLRRWPISSRRPSWPSSTVTCSIWPGPTAGWPRCTISRAAKPSTTRTTPPRPRSSPRATRPTRTIRAWRSTLPWATARWATTPRAWRFTRPSPPRPIPSMPRTWPRPTRWWRSTPTTRWRACSRPAISTASSPWPTPSWRRTPKALCFRTCVCRPMPTRRTTPRWSSWANRLPQRRPTRPTSRWCTTCWAPPTTPARWSPRLSPLSSRWPPVRPRRMPPPLWLSSRSRVCDPRFMRSPDRWGRGCAFCVGRCAVFCRPDPFRMPLSGCCSFGCCHGLPSLFEMRYLVVFVRKRSCERSKLLKNIKNATHS